MPHKDMSPTEQEKYYRIYKEYTFKFGIKWACSLKEYEEKRKNPFNTVTRDVNASMRRYLGSEVYTRYIDLLEYLILKEGILVKDEDNRLDIPLSTFVMWTSE